MVMRSVKWWDFPLLIECLGVVWSFLFCLCWVVVFVHCLCVCFDGWLCLSCVSARMVSSGLAGFFVFGAHARGFCILN